MGVGWRVGGVECMAAGLGGDIRVDESLSTLDELDDCFDGSWCQVSIS